MSIYALDYHTTGTDCWRLDTALNRPSYAGYCLPHVHLDHAGGAGRYGCVWRSFLFPRLRQYHTCA